MKEVEDYEVDDIWIGGAQWQLGVLYFNGLRVEKNESRAAGVFEKAARAGCPDAIAYMKRRAAHLRGGGSSIYLNLPASLVAEFGHCKLFNSQRFLPN